MIRSFMDSDFLEPDGLIAEAWILFLLITLNGELVLLLLGRLFAGFLAEVTRKPSFVRWSVDLARSIGVGEAVTTVLLMVN